MERIIKVTGKGKLSVKPDTIRLRINMEGKSKEYEETLRLSAENAELLKDLFEKLGFERKALKTLYFNVDTETEGYQDKDKSWKRRFKGYKFVHDTKIEFEADNVLLGRVLYALANCKIHPEFTIEYTVFDPEKCKNELLGKAVEDSMTKAHVLTSAAGVKLGDIVTIDYSWGEIDFVTRPMRDMMLECCAPDCIETKGYNIDIEAEDIDVTDTVTVVWRIE